MGRCALWESQSGQLTSSVDTARGTSSAASANAELRGFRGTPSASRVDRSYDRRCHGHTAIALVRFAGVRLSSAGSLQAAAGTAIHAVIRSTLRAPGHAASIAHAYRANAPFSGARTE
jgi:hypothetical protein